MVNRQNGHWLAQDTAEVPIVMHTKFPAWSVMVLGVVRSDGDVIAPH